MFRIEKSVIQAIIAHAKKELPNEACGYLASVNELVTSHYELTNIDQAPDHFNMEPREQFAAVKEMRSRGQALRGVYHSHPETPARPSAEDIRLAYDSKISFVIVSLAAAEPEIRSFLVAKGAVTEEPIEIIE
ncbi:MAG: M67 family metallopeptidase [Desulfobulbaceae bacterium]|nr:M67 family metallopeptidase [Desulfobulbaceae bacterium]